MSSGLGRTSGNTAYAFHKLPTGHNEKKDNEKEDNEKEDNENKVGTVTALCTGVHVPLSWTIRNVCRHCARPSYPRARDRQSCHSAEKPGPARFAYHPGGAGKRGRTHRHQFTSPHRPGAVSLVAHPGGRRPTTCISRRLTPSDPQLRGPWPPRAFRYRCTAGCIRRCRPESLRPDDQ